MKEFFQSKPCTLSKAPGFIYVFKNNIFFGFIRLNNSYSGTNIIQNLFKNKSKFEKLFFLSLYYEVISFF